MTASPADHSSSVTQQGLEEMAAFRRIAVEKGYVAETVFDAAAEERADRARRGEHLSIGQILVKRGQLGAQQFMEIARQMQTLRRVCGRCGTIDYTDRTRPGGRNSCVQCGAELDTIGTGSSPVLPVPGSAVQGELGKYKILREVGRGGMGVVYEAQDSTLRRRVALKVLHDDGRHPTRVKRLKREAQSAGRLSHPNVVSVHDVGSVPLGADGAAVHYIAMEFVEGRTLTRALPDLAPDVRLQVFETVVAAMAHAHSRGVVHRDLKPDNILIAGDGRVVVSDFGLATWTEGVSQLTKTGAILGSPFYMAPEQVRGEAAAISPATDVWSLGVTLFEVLTGKLPFQGHSAPAVFDAIVHRDPVPPRKLAPRAPAAVEAICLKCLEKERSDRYPDASALAADLARWRSGEPVKGPRIGIRSALARRVRRRPGAWIAAAGACSFFTVLFLTLWLVGEEPRHSPAPSPSVEEALAAHAAGDTNVAREWIDAMLAADPGDEEARYGSGRLFLREWLAALDLPGIRRTPGMLSALPPAPEPAGRMRLRQDAVDALRGTRGEALAEALEAISEGRFEEALQRIDESRGTAPESPGLWELDVLSSRCLYLLDRFADAGRRIDEVPRDADPPVAAPVRARCCLALGALADRSGLDPMVWFSRAEAAAHELVAAGWTDEGRVLEASTAILAADVARRRGADPAGPIRTAIQSLDGIETTAARMAQGEGWLVLAEDRRVRGSHRTGEATEHAQAIEAFSAALKAEPESAAAHLRRADTIRAWCQVERRPDPDPGSQPDARGALSDYQNARDLAPGLIAARVGMAWADCERKRADDLPYTSQVRLIATQCNDLDRILQEAPHAIEALVDMARAREEIARLHRENKMGSRNPLSSAVDAYETAIEVGESAELLRMRATALRQFAFAIRADGESPLPPRQRALADLARAIELDPVDAEAWGLRALLRKDVAEDRDPGEQEAVLDFQDALADATKAIQIQPDVSSHYDVRALVARAYGDVLAKVGKAGMAQHEAALLDHAKALELNPTGVESYRQRALLQMRLERPDLAVAECEAALEVDPDYATRSVSIHVTYLRALLAEADAKSEAGMDVRPSLRKAAGIASKAVGMFDPDLLHLRAEAYFQCGIALGPSDPQEGAEKLGLSIKLYDRLLDEWPDDPRVQTWRQERGRASGGFKSLRGN